MKPKPILFSPDMIKAILEGRKTQTRRVINNLPSEVRWTPVVVDGQGGWIDDHGNPLQCPYSSGQLLWVRETWRTFDDLDHLPPSGIPDHTEVWYEADGEPEWEGWGRKRPSIFMPRWASRITLKVVNVRAECLQDIDFDDALSEGIQLDIQILGTGATWVWHKDYLSDEFKPISAVDSFRTLWDSINAKRLMPWKLNPWVWVIEFEVKK